MNENLEFDNGWGGFRDGGSEYAIRIRRDETGSLVLPPRPWVNVIANERLGCIVSETGSSHTWAGNSREHRLTPWSNDPVVDPYGEALYVRDEESGSFWSPTPGPIPGAGDYEVRHGLGATTFLHESGGLSLSTTFFVPARDPVRIILIRARETGGRDRRISIFSYARLVLGGFAEDEGRRIVTERDPATGAVLARNPASGPFARAVAFARVLVSPGAGSAHASTNRARFLGRHGSPADPAALREPGPLAPDAGGGRTGPCFVLQGVCEIPAGSETVTAFLLGEGSDAAETARLLAAYEDCRAVETALEAARERWSALCGRVRVSTPSRALDILVNHWLPYQTLSCRIEARTALYQSGGAYGFRDQLQDAAAMIVLDPGLTRRQILLHAAHQFPEGDVLHWWHPPLSRGIRTRFADDLLWLPYLTAFYVETTGDRSILDEQAGFVSAPALGPGVDEVFLEPAVVPEAASLYEHCCRALDRSLVLGERGLPLFGTGDWNDAMNRVGRLGKGESVWMGFFLADILRGFVPICEARGDRDRAERLRRFEQLLLRNLNEAGWDGSWYRRAYYDDGAPMGSHGDAECRIDALVQSWSVLSGAAPPDRARMAIDAVEEHLVDEQAGVIKLLTPAFDKTPKDPGYIKGYAPGVRENGGQYTHAALWMVRATAELGRNNRAAALLDLLNPILHASTPEGVAVYGLEPYVVAADVYGETPHAGRGGWSWYTGSSGWMYRVCLESILGIRWRDGNRLVIRPCIPDAWPGYEVSLRIPGTDTRCTVVVENPSRAARRVIDATLDGAAVETRDGAVEVAVPQDGGEHRVSAILGACTEGGAA